MTSKDTVWSIANDQLLNKNKDDGKNSNHDEHALHVITTRTAPDEVTVHDLDDKKLVRKLDLRLLPGMTLLYLLNYLDRVNIGQAKINGLTKSLHLSSTQYNVCLSVFFVTYVIFEIPSNLILKKVRPNRWIPLIMIAWGIVMTLMGLVNSYGGLLACRLLLGAAEAGLFPGAAFYLSNWYKRRELTLRIAILFSAASIGGAFGGILAYGIAHMDGVGGQEGWRWIFYIEGIITVIVGVCAAFFIVGFPADRPRFLTEDECNRVLTRLRIDAAPGATEQFSWRQVRAAFVDWKVYIWSLCYIGIWVPLFSLAVYLPTIIQSLGFNSYKALLLTAPPYCFALFTSLTTAYFSDKYAQRGIFIVCWLLVAIVGFIIFLVASNSSVKYFAVFLTLTGVKPCVSTCLAFLSCNISPPTKRATSVAFMLSIASCGGVIGGQIYRSEDGPRFILGHAVNLGFCTLAIICALILIIGLRFENRRRDHLYGSSISSALTDVSGFGSVEEQQRQWGYENLSEAEMRDLGDKHATWRYIL